VIVLDTNLVSELMRPAPTAAVAVWIRGQRVGTLLTTAITVAEIRFGLARLPAGQRSRRLQQAADEVLAAFPNQVLPFDVAAASLYGQIAAARDRAGHPVDALDTQIAAICRAHDAPLATP
jgi:predicted nucleic acid-binding protein